MPRTSIRLIPVLLLLAGCARETPPDQELQKGALPPAGKPPEQFAAPVQNQGAVVDGWLATFKDKRLDALVAEALEYNRDLAAAKARVDQAASQARSAGADLKPQVGFAMDAATQGTGGSSARTDKLGTSLNLSWELDVWGRISSAQRAAQETYASKQADYAFARQSLAAQVAKDWFLVMQAVQQEDIAKEFAAIQRDSARLTELRTKGGRSSQYDLALARSALATADDQVEQAASGRESAVRSLEVLLGRYPKAELAVAKDLPPMPPPPPAGLPSQLLERRPDLISATRQVAAAFNQVESAKAARLPKLSITAATGVSSQDLKNLKLQDVFWNTAANFAGPIFDGGKLKEQVVLETARQQEALANFGKAALTAFEQVEKALSEDRRLGVRIELVQAADHEQSEAFRLARLRFDAGSIDQLTLLTVQGQALQTRLAALSVQVERLTNRVDLHLALGGGFEAPAPTAEDQLPASKIIAK